MRPEASKKLELPVVVALTLLAALLRWPGLSASFYGDEGFSLFRDSNALFTPTEDRFRFVFFTLLYLWKQIGFHGEVGLRLLPYLFGVLQVPVAFRLGRALGGLETAGIFAGLVAVNPLLIEFSQELRMYSMVPFLALLQALAFVHVLARAAEGKPTIRAWLGFVAAGVVGVYTHFHYWFLIVGFAAAMARRYRELPIRQSAAALAAIGALYLPDLPNLLRFTREAADQPHLRATDLPSALPKLLTADCIGFNYFPLPHMGIDRAVRVSFLQTSPGLCLLLVVPVGLLGWQIVRLHRRGHMTSMVWLAHELFTVPALVSFLAVLVKRSDFIHPKYMVFSAPFLLLLLVAAFQSLPNVAQRAAVAATGLAVFAVSIVHFNEPTEYGRREDWRGLAATLRARLDDQSVVLWLGGPTSPPEAKPNNPPQSVWEYYGADLFPRVRTIAMPSPNATPAQVTSLIRSLTAGERHVYYVWGEIMANTGDPGGSVIASAEGLFGDEKRIQFNPRFALYEWTSRD
jgi:hypothetical protein